MGRAAGGGPGAAQAGGGCRGAAAGTRTSRRASAIASSSVLTRKSPHPETEQCMRAPPSSSSVTFSPMTISAMRGEPRYMEAFPSTMTTTSQKAGM